MAPSFVIPKKRRRGRTDQYISGEIQPARNYNLPTLKGKSCLTFPQRCVVVEKLNLGTFKVSSIEAVRGLPGSYAMDTDGSFISMRFK